MRLFLLLCTLVTVGRVSSESTTIRYVYNSSDLSYFSNGIQFPAPDNDLTNPIVGELENQEKRPDMLWLRDLYDHHKWIGYVNQLNNTQCKKDLLTYIRELYNGTSWATKSQSLSLMLLQLMKLIILFFFLVKFQSYVTETRIWFDRVVFISASTFEFRVRVLQCC